mgnify:CR=1 FL=1
MIVTILTMNLQGYINWNNRKDLITKIIKKYNPDIIAFQEIHLDKMISNKDTMNQLNKELKYPYKKVLFYFDYSKDYGRGIFQRNPMKEGLGILAKYKFTTKKLNLPIIKGLDRWPRIAMLCDFKKLKLANIHLSKYKESREKQWKLLSKDHILIGDFNMNPNELKKIKGNQILSYDFKKYISYPKDKTTYDYSLLPKGKFLEVKIINQETDHKAIYFKIEI